MNKFAVLLTCFNRKEKTIKALNALHSAYNKISREWEMSIYLTDDGSTDGTSDAVIKKFPKVNILKGSGSLYWAGGMRNSWTEAKKGDYGAYLLLNDDTNIHPDVFNKIFETEKYCLKTFKEPGIYVGTTIDAESGKVSYGGSVFTNRFLGKMKRVHMDNKTPMSCELGNANIMWVPKNVVEIIGILSPGYIHGMADYDYTMKAVKKKIPVLTLPGVSGECINDHGEIYERFEKLSFKERVRFLYNPVGLDFSSQLYHMRRHFPIRLPLFYLMGWFKVIFPNIYAKKVYGSRVG
ncbi:glycosyltransferase family 2 protein [Flagellimonas sp.]|uniref:glycosyltransferase family 2 protein n=1 Tax=Flagellimonas sp. TaxID=2058762 RepID=UPI003B50BFDC